MRGILRTKKCYTMKFAFSKVVFVLLSTKQGKVTKVTDSDRRNISPFFCPVEEILNSNRKWKKNSQKILAPFIPVKVAHWEKGC